MKRIDIKGIKLFAYHGCLEEEAKIGGNYVIDLKLYYDFEKAALEDVLSDTIDYVVVNKIVQEEMGIRSKLIETVAKRIVTRLKLEFPKLEKTEITVTKITPPINGDVESVSAVIVE